MRKAPYTNGFLLCFLLNLFLNYWLGLIGLGLIALHLWLGIPLFIALIALAAWLGMAMFATVLVSLAANNGNAPAPVQKNANPYSAKTSDYLKPSRDPEPQAGSTAAPAEREANLQNVVPIANAPSVSLQEPAAEVSDWAEISHCLYDAVTLLKVSEAEYDELEKQVLTGARDPDFIAKGGRLSDSDKFYWFLDGLDELGYIAYQSNNATYKLIADSLSLSAHNQGLPPVPAELAEERTEQNLFIGSPEMLTARLSAKLIAALVKNWRAFLINDGTDGCYLGVVSPENAASFATRMNGCFSMVGHGYSIELL